MSEYKISYKLLKQQTEEMQKLSTQMTTLSQRVAAASSKLGQDELLAKARTSLQQCTTKINDTAQVITTAASLIEEVMGEYTGTEKKNVGKAEGTKAHSRDFYKNPVVISDAAADSATAGVSSPKSSSSYAKDVYDSFTPTSQENSAFGGDRTAYRVSSDGVPTGAAAGTVTTEAPAAATVSGGETDSSVIGTAAAVAGGVAAGAAATVAGIKLKGKKNKEELEANSTQTISPPTEEDYSAENSRAILQAEESLREARERLNNL